MSPIVQSETNKDESLQAGRFLAGPRRFDCRGKVALVTGGAGAIGSAVAIGLAEHGADVAVVDLREAEAMATAARIDQLGRNSFGMFCDVRSAQDAERTVARTVEEFGSVEILVHVAGFATLRPILDMPLEEFEGNLASCLTGAFLISKTVGQAMVSQRSGGSIVHISSIASVRALGRGTGSYAAAKAGLNALVRELAIEWAPHRIRVNAVAPCQIKTPGLDRVLDERALGGREALTAEITSRIPLTRLGEPEEIVGPCIFLASEAASLVTGQVLFVDGGYTAQ